MKASKKGFTLIELLAVIVILAVIALIATPIVLNLINTARKGAFTRSAEGVLRGANLYYSNSLLKLNELKDINFTCDNKECISDKVDENNNPIKLDVDGSMGNGNITIKSDGNILFTLTDDKYCAVKYENNSRVQLVDGNCSNIDLTNDTTQPEIYSVTTVVTTNSIRVTVGAKDDESGIYGYEYSIDGGENYTDIIRSNTYTFEGLKNDKKYNVKVRVYNGTYGKDTYSDANGRKEKEFDNNPISLNTIETPEFTILPEGWSLEKEVTIKYHDALIQEYSIDGGNTYVEYTNSFKITENINIIAKASDGINVITTSKTISKIDKDKPTIEVSDINTSYDTKDEITLTLNDNSSGVTHYCVTSESIIENISKDCWKEVTVKEIGTLTEKYTINTNGIYYAYSKDAVGNISEGKEFVIDKVDTESPSASLEVTSKTTKSITVKATCTDNVGITKYEYSYDNGANYTQGTNNTYTFSNLTTGTYNMKVRCFDEAGNVSNEASVTDTTKNLDIPTYAVSDPEEWRTSKTVTIRYPEGYINEYIIESGSATKEDGTVLENNKPYPANSITEKVIFTSDGNIVARTSDGKNTVKASSQKVSKIDTTAPSAPTVMKAGDIALNVLDLTQWHNVDVYFPLYYGEEFVSGSIDNESGIAHYEISEDNLNWHDWSDYSLTGVYKASSTTTRYYRAINNAGLASPSASITVKIDKVNPTISYSVAGGTYNSYPTVRVTASDTNYKAMSVHVYKDGVKIDAKTVNGLTSNTYDVALDSDGNWIIYAYVIDQAGNKQNQTPQNSYGWYYQQYTIDKTNPTVSYSVAGGTYNSYQTVRVTASDTNYSSMAVHVYKNSALVYSGKVDAKSTDSTTSNTFDVALDSDGTWTIYTLAYDKAGNKQNQNPNNGDWYYQQYVIATPDTVTPVATLGVINGAGLDNGWVGNTNSINFNLQCSVGKSGVASYKYTVYDTGFKDYKGNYGLVATNVINTTATKQTHLFTNKLSSITYQYYRQGYAKPFSKTITGPIKVELTCTNGEGKTSAVVSKTVKIS